MCLRLKVFIIIFLLFTNISLVLAFSKEEPTPFLKCLNKAYLDIKTPKKTLEECVLDIKLLEKKDYKHLYSVTDYDTFQYLEKGAVFEKNLKKTDIKKISSCLNKVVEKKQNKYELGFCINENNLYFGRMYEQDRKGYIANLGIYFLTGSEKYLEIAEVFHESIEKSQEENWENLYGKYYKNFIKNIDNPKYYG